MGIIATDLRSGSVLPDFGFMLLEEGQALESLDRITAAQAILISDHDAADLALSTEL